MTDSRSPALARTVLFVPATRIDRIPKALGAGADLVVVDLEDAVEQHAKASAREALAAFLAADPQVRVLVRVNGADTPEHDADLAMCNGSAGVAGIMLPKAESAAQIAHTHAGGKPVWPIIESARAVVDLAAIAAAPGVARLAFGTLDFGHDTGIAADTPGALVMLDHVRCQMVLHSRVAGIGAPIDGVFPAIDQPEGLKRYARHARDLGFGGMLCIHPAQVAGVHAAFAPSAAEVERARRIVEHAERTGQAAFQFEGEMVDPPVVLRARDVLARAG